MAMDGTVLGTAIATTLGVAGNPVALAAWISIATAVVTHLASNAVVAAAGPDPQGGIVTSVGTIS